MAKGPGVVGATRKPPYKMCSGSVAGGKATSWNGGVRKAPGTVPGSKPVAPWLGSGAGQAGNLQQMLVEEGVFCQDLVEDQEILFATDASPGAARCKVPGPYVGSGGVCQNRHRL